MQQNPFTSEQILQSAQGNLTANIYAIMAYLKHKNIPIEEWVLFTSSQFAPAWESLKNEGVSQIASSLVLNMLSAGATIITMDVDHSRARLVLDFPIDDTAAFFGVTPDEAAIFTAGVFEPIITGLGLGYRAHRSGTQWTFELWS